MNQTMNSKQENRLMAATLFVFFVSGASSMLMGNLMPFLREQYDISYSRAGFLLSLPSWGNLASIFITGYLPTYIGRRKTVLLTSVWMAMAFILVAFGIGGAALLPVACAMIGIARGGNTNFSNTMMSTLPGNKSAVGYNLLHGAFAVGAVLSPIALIACTNAFDGGWKYMTMGIIVLCLVQISVYARMNLPQEKITGSIKTVDRSFLKNKNFWLALIPAVLLLAQVVMAVFGVEIDLGDIGDKLLAVVNALFVVLSILGIVTDPTTAGVSDSTQARTYSEPKK
jgi:phi LC3 family holin